MFRFTARCCTPDAFDMMLSVAKAPAYDHEALLAGAAAIGLHFRVGLKLPDFRERLQEVAADVRGRVRCRDPEAIMAHLHEVLFKELGWGGSLPNYDHPANAFVCKPVKRLKGLPISLSLAYAYVARELGLEVRGLNIPGHFCAGVMVASPFLQPDEREVMIVDVFNGGRLLNVMEAAAMANATYGPCDITDATWSATSNRAWLTRIMQSLVEIHEKEGKFTDVAALLELELLLWPDQMHLHRDIAICYTRGSDQFEAAANHLAYYLEETHPSVDRNRGQLDDLLVSLRRLDRKAA